MALFCLKNCDIYVIAFVNIFGFISHILTDPRAVDEGEASENGTRLIVEQRVTCVRRTSILEDEDSSMEAEYSQTDSTLFLIRTAGLGAEAECS